MNESHDTHPDAADGLSRNQVVAILTRASDNAQGIPAPVALSTLALVLELGGRPETDPLGAWVAARWELIKLRDGGWHGPAEALREVFWVGAEVMLADPADLDVWHQVAACLLEHPNTVAIGEEVGEPVQVTMSKLLHSGWGALEARWMVEAAMRANAPVGLLGFGSDMKPSLLLRAVDAGITHAGQASALRRIGLSWEEVFAVLDHGHVCPEALCAAAADRLPQDQWLTRLRGMPAHWFPDACTADPLNGSPLRLGYSWTDLNVLLMNGWRDITPQEMDTGVRPQGMSAKARLPLTRDECVALAQAGVSLDETQRWAKVLLRGKPATYTTPARPALLPDRPSASTFTKAVVQLHTAGITPSRIARFRKDGCDAVDEVLAAHRGASASA